MAAGVDSVAHRHKLVYAWETLVLNDNNNGVLDFMIAKKKGHILNQAFPVLILLRLYIVVSDLDVKL